MVGNTPQSAVVLIVISDKVPIEINCARRTCICKIKYLYIYKMCHVVNVARCLCALPFDCTVSCFLILAVGDYDFKFN